MLWRIWQHHDKVHGVLEKDSSFDKTVPRDYHKWASRVYKGVWDNNH